MEDYIDYIEKLNSAKEPYRGPLASLLRGGIAVPALSATAMKLVALAEDEKSSLEDIEAVISLDPGLVSRCLQIACTSSYSRQPITEIRQALLMLGQRQVRQVAFTSEVMSSLAEFKGDKGDKWEHYWLHSLLTARLADQLARAFNQDTGLEYLAGLLHDCGEIFMARYFPKDWNELRSVEFEDPDDSIEIEDKQFGVNHAQVSAAIAQTLGLHSKIVRAIAFHHSPPPPPLVQHQAGDQQGFPAGLYFDGGSARPPGRSKRHVSAGGPAEGATGLGHARGIQTHLGSAARSGAGTPARPARSGRAPVIHW
jgi:putative nucleotidyltransferase with HDIG domain